jgi:hypothetical protein
MSTTMLMRSMLLEKGSIWQFPGVFWTKEKMACTFISKQHEFKSVVQSG